MRFETCWLCENELTATREHIIPESMGGKKTVVGFICRDCNSKTGYNWDAAVADFESWKFQLNPNLRINPRRGKSIRGNMAETGLNVLVDSGVQVRLGFNAPTKTQEETGQVTYHFTCDPGRVDSLFDSVNTLLQRKGKNPITREEFDCSIRYNSEPNPVVNFTLQLQIHKYYRSLVKTAMAMAFSVGIKPTECGNAVRYLRDETIGEERVVTLPGTSLEGILDDWADYHAVTIFGFPSERKLIGEVLYFGNVAGLVILSNSYEGARIIAGHAINLGTGEYVDADLNVPNLHLPAYSGIELLKSRVGRFKSPMVLQVLSDLGPIGTDTRRGNSHLRTNDYEAVQTSERNDMWPWLTLEGPLCFSPATNFGQCKSSRGVLSLGS